MKHRMSLEEAIVGRRLAVHGMVQGVGFRPFVYQLAHRYGLKGDVANTSSGVTIHVEGGKEKIEAFVKDLTEKSPPLARITRMSNSCEPVKGYQAFAIPDNGSFRCYYPYN